MQHIVFVTGNQHKISAAIKACAALDITVGPLAMDIVEIQSEDGETITRDKAQKAYDQLQKPLVVVDDTWVVPGLKGFPGPYMKSINTWFTNEDWLRLTLPLTDRRIILRQYAIYQDEQGQTLFTYDIVGTLLTAINGHAGVNKQEDIASFGDSGKSVSQLRAEGVDNPISDNHNVWHDIAGWLAAK